MSKKIGQGIRQTFRKSEIKVNVLVNADGTVSINHKEGDKAKFEEILKEKFADINSPENIEARKAGIIVKPVREKKVKEAKEKKSKKEKGTVKISREQMAEELDSLEDDQLRDLAARALAGKEQTFPMNFVGKSYKEAAGKMERAVRIDTILSAYSAPEAEAAE